MKPCVISSVAQKGGVGKTTSLIGAALLTAEKGLKTCVIDLDEQGSASGALYSNHHELGDRGAASAFNLAKQDSAVEPYKINENLFLLHASLDLLQLDNDALDLYFKLKGRIESCLADFDVVYIDTPGTLKTRVVAALVASDWFYSPIELAEYSVRSINPLIEQFKTIRAHMNQNLGFAGMLPNKVHGIRTGMPVQVAEREIYFRLSESLGGPEFLLGMIGDRKYIREALSMGESLTGNAAEDARKAKSEIQKFTDTLLKRSGIE